MTHILRRWPALGVLGLCMLVLNLDTTIINVALATLARDLHADTGQLQWITTAYLLTGAALMLLAGAIGDRRGRKRTLVGGLIVFALASVLGAWAPSAGILIAARALMGVGSAVVMPMSMALIPVLFPDPAERGQAIALWSATVVLGMPLGPIVGGLLLGHFWWGSIFLINVVVIAVAVPLGLWLLPGSRSPRPGHIDPVSVVLSIAGCAALVYGFIDAGTGWGRLPVLAALRPGSADLTVSAGMAGVGVGVGPHAAGTLKAVAFTAFTHGTGIVLACCAAVALAAIGAVAAIPGKSRPARGGKA
jgi:MFS family permease